MAWNQTRQQNLGAHNENHWTSLQLHAHRRCLQVAFNYLGYNAFGTKVLVPWACVRTEAKNAALVCKKSDLERKSAAIRRRILYAASASSCICLVRSMLPSAGTREFRGWGAT